MSAASPADRPDDPSAPLDRLTRAGATLLGLSGAGAIGLSALLRWRPVGVAPSVPPVLALLGAGTVAGAAIAPRLLRYAARAPDDAPAPSGVPAAECPTCERREAHARRWESFHAALRAAGPPAPSARSVPRPAVHASTTAGFLWSSWVPSDGTLPVGLIGPVPETAYLAPAADAPAVFLDRTPTIFVDLRSGELAALPGTELPEAFTEATPDPLGAPGTPAAGPNASSSARATHRIAPFAGSTDALPVMIPEEEDADALLSMSGGFAGPFGNSILAEALTPTPPHLRPAPPARIGGPDRRPARSRTPVASQGAEGAHCASCRDPIGAPASWRRCHDCARPLCHACVVSSLVERQRAWCTACAAEHGVAVLDAGS